MLCTGKLGTYGWDSRNNGSSDDQGQEESEDTSEHIKRLGDCEVGKSTGIGWPLRVNFEGLYTTQERAACRLYDGCSPQSK